MPLKPPPSHTLQQMHFIRHAMTRCRRVMSTAYSRDQRWPEQGAVCAVRDCRPFHSTGILQPCVVSVIPRSSAPIPEYIVCGMRCRLGLETAQCSIGDSANAPLPTCTLSCQ